MGAKILDPMSTKFVEWILSMELVFYY